ncbi:hypothetical protein EV2_032977 [Malus domestica]
MNAFQRQSSKKAQSKTTEPTISESDKQAMLDSTTDNTSIESILPLNQDDTTVPIPNKESNDPNINKDVESSNEENAAEKD